jgi:hypothetical protein
MFFIGVMLKGLLEREALLLLELAITRYEIGRICRIDC